MKRLALSKVFGLVAVLLIGWVVMYSEPAAACKCEAPKDTQEELGASSAVFAGKAIKIDGDTVHFDVAMLWKGPKQKRITVSNAGGDCGFPFMEGKEYVVYARGAEDKPVTSLCSRTLGVSQASNEVQALGNPLYDFTAQTANSRGNSREPNPWFIGLGVLLFLLMAVLLYHVFRRKPL